ncbi:MAG: hypothetical protein IT378_23305 [Sandaracinaceae bacterium]|nr:hypothetical protein [Sandaracinaceae bacterium]
MSAQTQTASPFDWTKVLYAAAGLGVVLVGVGVALEGARPWAALLLAGHFGVSVAVGAGLLIALFYLMGAGWSVAVRRVPEAISSVLPWCALVMAGAAVGIGSLYHWVHVDPNDHVLAAKQVWLNIPFFLGRGAVYVLVWSLMLRAIRNGSTAQDRDGHVEHTHRNVRWSAAFVVVFGLTFSAATFDWIMSLDPHWFSTMFAVHNFAGALQTAIALTAVVVVVLRRQGKLEAVKDDHLHDLGRLLFGMSCFWAYIWFCQFMLIWYANIPEETDWFVDRMINGWQVIFLLVPALLFLLPFGALMRRESKRSEGVLLLVGGVVLLGRWVELYLSITPTVSPTGPVLGASEIGATLLGGSVLILALRTALARVAVLPRKDPYVEESLAHRVGHTM